jgi:hypothetical protein
LPKADFLAVDLDESKPPIPALWLPYTLRRFYLSSLAILSLVLSVFLVIVSTYSLRNHGLGNDDGSLGLFFARRYMPTMVAVFFTLAISMVAEDVKRTEAFARMASPKPVAASYTLFYVPKVWWKSIYDGLSPKRNGGHRRWILSLSSLSVGVSVLVISTFSSSIFTTKEVLLQAESQLQLYTTQQDGLINLLPRPNTYFRTVSGFLHNTSTSLWVSDSYVVLPFALSNEGTNHQWLSDGVWEAVTKVMKLESVCVPMDLTLKTAFKFADHDNCTSNNTCTISRGFKLRSKDGCEIQIQSPILPTIGTSITRPVAGYFTDALSLQGGMMWTNLSSSHVFLQDMMSTNLSSSYVSLQDMIREYGGFPSKEDILDQWRRTFVYNISDKCVGRELLLVSPPWDTEYYSNYLDKPEIQDSYWANFTTRAEICTPIYYEADMPVTAAIGGAFPKISFDESDFVRRRRPIPKELLDLDRLNKFAFGESWSKYMTVPRGEMDFEGVSMLLAKAFSSDLTDMIQNHALPSQAMRLRARFFGELIWSSVMEADVPSSEDTVGRYTRTKTRIVVVSGIGISLAVLLFLTACYLLAMLWYASDSERPLNLRSDPATLTGTASLVKITSKLAAHLRSWRDHDGSKIQEKIESQVYTLRIGTFREQKQVANIDGSAAVSKKEDQSQFKKNTPKKVLKHDRRPSMLCKRWLVVLLASLVAITTTLLVLRKYADKGMLFQTAFIQQVRINQLHVNVSPHSLIATLVAIIIGLCWDGIDKSLRILQPYLAMSRVPSKPAHGISLSYNSSYWVWAALKSARSRHWMLCLVTIGTTLTQICKVTSLLSKFTN